eukprot:jgi/Hompol1/2942/HPOL_006273-RA
MPLADNNPDQHVGLTTTGHTSQNQDSVNQSQHASDKPPASGSITSHSAIAQAKDDFWPSYLRDVHEPLPLSLAHTASNTTGSAATTSAEIIPISFSIDLQTLTQTCAALKTTPTALFILSWGLTLRKYYRTNHVVFGRTIGERAVAPARVFFDDSDFTTNVLRRIAVDESSVNTYFQNYPEDLVRFNDGATFGEMMPTVLKISQPLPNVPINVSDYNPILSLAVLQDRLHFKVSLTYQPAKLNHDHAVLIGAEFEECISMVTSSISKDIPISSFWNLSKTQREIIDLNGIGEIKPSVYERMHTAFEAQAV